MDVIHFAHSAPVRVSVLILSRHDPNILHSCLSTICYSLQRTSYEVLLLLNGATPDLREYVNQRVSGLRLFESSVNLGFSGGMNYLA